MANPWEEDWSQQALPVQVGRVDPFKVRADNRAQEAADRANANSDAANARSADANALARERFIADLYSKGLQPGPNGQPVPIPGWVQPGAKAKGDPGKAGAYQSVIQQVNRLYELYNQGIGTTSGLSGILDYLPSDANAAFDTAGAALGDQGNAAFKVPGMGAQSDADAARFVAANQPQSGDRDVAALEKLRAIRQRLENNMAAVGLPAPQWGYDLQGRAVAPASNDQPIPAANLGGGTPPAGGGPMGGLTPEQMGGLNRQAALQGALSRDQGVVAGDPNARDTAIPVPPEFQNELISYVMQNRATVTPEQIDAKVRELASRFNYPAQAGNSVDVVNAVRKGAPYQGIQPSRRNMTGLEQVQNQFIQSPLGSTAAGFLNAGGMGIPKMLSADEYGAIENTNPMSSLAGEVGGAIMGSSLIGRAGANIASKVAPRLLGGGRGAQFGRNLATDATYGGIYGGTTEGDPVTGALAAGLGSGLGQGVASGIGRAVGGVKASAPARSLQRMGVNSMTLGQMLGGKAKGLEDALSSAPVIGDIVNARRLEGLQDFNLAALNQAGSPIGATVSETGEAGLGALRSQISGAYDNATSGVNVPLDPQFSADMAGVAAAGSRLPPDYAARFDKIGQNRVGPIIDAGQLTGETYQQSMRGLKNAKATAGQAAPGFEQDYRDAVVTAMDALTGQMKRGGGSRVVEGLGQADNAYRLSKTLENAQAAAKNGTNSGEVQIFTPAQLNTAGYAATRKFPGPRPFASLADTGQQVLPSKIPDSGTARRVATLALPTALGGTGVGLGAIPGGPDATAGGVSGLALGTLLALGGSKAGQKALKAAMLDRGKSARRVGATIRKRKGLFGSAAAPLLIENSTN